MIGGGQFKGEDLLFGHTGKMGQERFAKGQDHDPQGVVAVGQGHTHGVEFFFFIVNHHLGDLLLFQAGADGLVAGVVLLAGRRVLHAPGLAFHGVAPGQVGAVFVQKRQRQCQGCSGLRLLLIDFFQGRVHLVLVELLHERGNLGREQLDVAVQLRRKLGHLPLGFFLPAARQAKQCQPKRQGQNNGAQT